jgi:hypothetical protein
MTAWRSSTVHCRSCSAAKSWRISSHQISESTMTPSRSKITAAIERAPPRSGPLRSVDQRSRGASRGRTAVDRAGARLRAPVALRVDGGRPRAARAPGRRSSTAGSGRPSIAAITRRRERAISSASSSDAPEDLLLDLEAQQPMAALSSRVPARRSRPGSSESSFVVARALARARYRTKQDISPDRRHEDRVAGRPGSSPHATQQCGSCPAPNAARTGSTTGGDPRSRRLALRGRARHSLSRIDPSGSDRGMRAHRRPGPSEASTVLYRSRRARARAARTGGATRERDGAATIS